MAVFKLTDKDREEIINAATDIARRKQEMEVSRFPLTISDLELVLNDPDGLIAARAAEGLGYKIEKMSDLRMRISYKSLGVTQEICPKFIGVSLRPENAILAQRMFVARNKAWVDYNDCKHYFNMGVLPEHTRLRLADWVNKVHRAVAERNLCVNVVRNYLPHMPSTANVLATWPTLATLVRRETKEGMRLRDRFAGGPPARTLHRYRVTWPSTSEFEDPKTMMAGAEEVLVKNLMLEEKYSPLPETGVSRIDVIKFESKPDAPWYLKAKP